MILRGEGGITTKAVAAAADIPQVTSYSEISELI